MGSPQGGARRVPASRELGAGAVWCDAAERVRLVVERLPMPGHVAGYLRGYADVMEFHCVLGASADTIAGDVVDARSGQLAAYTCEPPSSRAADVWEQRRTIEIAAGQGRFTVASWHEDTEAHSANRRSTGLQGARAAIQSGDAGGLVVADLARLGRNSLDVLDLLERSDAEGWRVVALDCRLDSTAPTGRLVVQALRRARKLEWRNVSAAKRRGIQVGSGRRQPPATPVGLEAAVAERITAMRMDGKTYRAIAAALNADGVPAPDEHGWRVTSVRAALQAARGGG